jgi:DivIVA domain-containing protein
VLALEVLVGAAVLVGVALLVSGRFEGLADDAGDVPDLGLPAGRPLRSDDVRRLRFRVVGGLRGGLRGYRMEDVDEAMRRVEEALRTAEQPQAVMTQPAAMTQPPPLPPTPIPPAEPEPLPPAPPPPVHPEPTPLPEPSPLPEPPFAEQPPVAGESTPLSALEEGWQPPPPAQGE